MRKTKPINGKKTVERNSPAKNSQEIADRAIGPWVLACLGFTAIMFLLLKPLFLQQAEPMWDARDLGYPAFSYLSDAIREGRFPLWDPYTNCGLPFHADPNSPTLNPVALFFAYFLHDSAVGFTAFWTFHWIWGGIGMIWLTRYFHGRPMGGVFAATAYALSGFFIGHAEHTTFITVAAWLPWIFWFADKAVLTPNRGWALLGGFSFGMASLGGYPGLVTFTGFAVMLWLVLRFLPAWGLDSKEIPPVRERMFRTISTLVIIAVVSLLVWLPVLNAFFTEGRAYTSRVAALSPEVANYGGPFTLPALFSLFYPYVTIAGRAWMGTDISFANGYVGILTIPFAVLWWWNERKRQHHWWIVIFIVFMFLLSFGGKAGVRTLLYYIYPPMQFNRHNAPFRLYWMLPVTLMAGLGFSYLQSYLKSVRTVRSIFSGYFVIAICVSAGLIYFLSSHGVRMEDYSPRLFLPAMLILPFCLLIIWANENVRTSLLRSRMLLPLVMILVVADMAGHLYNNSFTVWSPGNSTRQAEALRQRTTLINGEPGPRIHPFPFGAYNAQQILKRPVVLGYVPMSNGYFNVLSDSRFGTVLQSSTRFWINPGREQIPDGDAALAILSSIGAGDPVPAFVERKTDVPLKARVVPGSYGKAKVISYAPENIELDVEVPVGADGFLSSTERYAPGWKGSVDGKPGEVIKTNVFFRGMVVPPGRHQIIWKYDPDRWVPLVWVSFSALLASAFAGIVIVQRKKTGTDAL